MAAPKEDHFVPKTREDVLDEEFVLAGKALQEKVCSDEVLHKLEAAIKLEQTLANSIALIELFRYRDLFDNSTTRPKHHPAVDAFLKAHAPEEWDRYNAAKAAVMRGMTASKVKVVHNADDADREFERAREALKVKIHSDAVWDELLAEIEKTGNNDAAALKQALKHDRLINGYEIPENDKPAVDAFLKAHAPEEFKAYNDAAAKVKGGVDIEAPNFADRTKRALGSAAGELTSLSGHFMGLDDDKAMALGSAIERATSDAGPILAALNKAQRDFDARMNALKAEVIDKGLLRKDRAAPLVEDVRNQLEAHALSQANASRRDLQ